VTIEMGKDDVDCLPYVFSRSTLRAAFFQARGKLGDGCADVFKLVGRRQGIRVYAIASSADFGASRERRAIPQDVRALVETPCDLGKGRYIATIGARIFKRELLTLVSAGSSRKPATAQRMQASDIEIQVTSGEALLLPVGGKVQYPLRQRTMAMPAALRNLDVLTD
jgi:hypothetical protein